MIDSSITRDATAEFLKYASPLRRLGAMLYDSLLIVAVLFVTTLPFIPLMGNQLELQGAAVYLYRACLFGVTVAFFVFFWTRKGRTLGMQAWQLRIQTLNGELPSWRDAMLRFAVACAPIVFAITVLAALQVFILLGAGLQFFVLLSVPVASYLAGYFDGQYRALHERWLRTRIVRA